MKKWIKKQIPSATSLQKSRQLKKLNSFFNSNCFWERDCQTMARGVAAGFAGAVIPGFQILYAALLVLVLRGNLPVALLCTLITNPLTVVPFTYFIYYIGTLFIGNNNSHFEIKPFHWDFSSFHAFWINVSTWVLQFGKAFLIGLPIVSLGLGIIGYFGTIIIWKTWTSLSHKKSKVNHK